MMNDNPWHSVRRVLAIRLDNLGDVLVTSPAIHAMKESLPSAELTLLAGPVGAQVARLNPDIDDVIVNVFGAFVGYAVFSIVGTRKRRRPEAGGAYN